jgi:hypothetical protein
MIPPSFMKMGQPIKKFSHFATKQLAYYTYPYIPIKSREERGSFKFSSTLSAFENCPEVSWINMR